MKKKFPMIIATGLFLAASLMIPRAGAGTTTGGFFLVTCDYSHSLMDDPIVFHKQPGASHMHDFYANTTTNAFSNPLKLLGGPTTCTDSLDSSGYWIPQTLLNGIPVTPDHVEIYWLPGPAQTVVAPPAGLNLIGGNKNATSDQDIKVVHFNCGSNPDFISPFSSKPYDCTPYMALGSDGVVETVNFPNCWDGNLTGRADQTAHFAYRGAPKNSCPAGFTTDMAQISFRVHTGIVDPLNADGSIALSFTSGPYYTLHADFMNGWNQDELQSLVDSCLNAHAQCFQIRK